MAVSSCNSRNGFKYREKSFHSGDGQTLGEVTWRGCGISVLGETQNSARWDHRQPSRAGSAVNGRLEQISLEFPTYLSHFMILFCNSNRHKQLLSSKCSTQNKVMKSGALKVKEISYGNKFSAATKVKSSCHQRFQMEKKNVCMQSQFHCINFNCFLAEFLQKLYICCCCSVLITS